VVELPGLAEAGVTGAASRARRSGPRGSGDSALGRGHQRRDCVGLRGLVLVCQWARAGPGRDSRLCRGRLGGGRLHGQQALLRLLGRICAGSGFLAEGVYCASLLGRARLRQLAVGPQGGAPGSMEALRGVGQRMVALPSPASLTIGLIRKTLRLGGLRVHGFGCDARRGAPSPELLRRTAAVERVGL
jgi:hypothetical protein